MPVIGRHANAIACLFVLLGVLAILAFVPRAKAHDIYKHWSPPNNPKTSCCNNNDCRPTRAYMGDDGLWRAWNGQLWLIVPPDRVLPTDFAGDGRSHLCEMGAFVYCFSPGQPRG
jgi:hypothetical protein